jgi:small-conductance mechanosensitive channel
MKLRHWIVGIVLLLLMGAAVGGMIWTRELPAPVEDASAPSPTAQTSTSQASTSAAKKPGGRKALVVQRPLVDQRPLLTAQRMGAMAGTPEEQALAHEAAKLGDHEVDLAFLDALRTAQQNPPPLKPEAKEIAARRAKAEQTVKEDQDSVAQLKKKLAGAPDAQKDNLQDQLDVAQAQLDLDQDELDDANEDLEQAGGDPQSKIKHLQAEHEAGEHSPNAVVGSAINPHELDYQSHTLWNAFRAWQALREKATLLEQARLETAEKQRYLAKRHDLLEAQVEKDKQSRDQVKQNASGFTKGSSSKSREDSKTAAKSALDSLKQFTLDQKNLADRGRRLQDEEDLNDVYGNWIVLVEARERTALHRMIESVLWILVVLFVVYLAARVIDRQFTGMSAENKRIDTLRTVVKFAVQVVGALVILFIVIGMPTQTTTVLGLAGAGLTVAMKDFIVAFFGWFVLMGRNGIRAGDWVEINGVGGEVVEIGLLKTVLLETGNWTDSSHPTGRRVSFVNSFAIEGHFFNFTTSGQWMWDELQLLVPPGQDPYAVIDNVRKLVEKETASNSAKAEAEWQETTNHYRAKTLSAMPGINVVPTAAGIEVRVRYITRPFERHEVRRRLYEAAVDVMHGRREAVKSQVPVVSA